MATAHTHTPEEHNHIRRWIVVLSSALFFFYEFIQMHMFNAITKDLMASFNMDATQLGNLSATYLYADTLFLLPAGIILDRFSTRKVILWALAACIIGTVGFALSTTVFWAGVFHFISGAGNGFCFLCCIRLASRWFPTRMLAFVIGLVVTMAFLGGLTAETPLTILTSHFEWRHVVIYNAVLGAIIFVIIYFLVHDYPQGYEKQHQLQKEQLNQIGFWKSFGLALNNTQNWLAGVYTSFLNLPIMLLCALWGNLYLMQIHNVTNLQASNIVSMIFIGSMVGCPIVGIFSDRIGLRKLPMILGAVLSIFSISVLLYVPNLSYTALLIIFLLIGFFTSAQVLAYPVITESNNRIITSTATALGSLLIMGGAAIFQSSFGYIMDRNWQGVMHNGIRAYPDAAFNHAMLIFPITFIIALIISFIIRETYCRELNTHNQTTA